MAKNKCAASLGRKGGLKTKALKKGIFSAEYKRKKAAAERPKFSWDVSKQTGYVVNATKYTLLVDGKVPNYTKKIRIRKSQKSKVYTVFDDFFYSKEFKTLALAKKNAIQYYLSKK